ncbi:NAD(P)H-binding protein [Nannocystis pusilla]|uniref:NAD(P)H-binding protein n=1 Tax=Nannocystis pusilla TaxID=889268 RepID=UPI003B80C731
MSTAPGRVLVVGGTGRTGRHVVSLLREADVPLRLLVRDRARAEAELGAGLDLVVGDALDLDLGPAFAGVERVVSTLGSRDVHGGGLRTVDLPATARLVAAAREAGVARFVLCSTIGAVPTPGVPRTCSSGSRPRARPRPSCAPAASPSPSSAPAVCTTAPPTTRA